MLEEMNFKDAREFYYKREDIRNKYLQLNYARKYIYKSYVYSRDIVYSHKNTIWEYLNEPDDSIYYIDAKIRMINFIRGVKNEDNN